MAKNSLASKGLSLSQAQSISNLCNQRAVEIEAKLKAVNNSSRKIKIDGEMYQETQPVPMPANVVELLKEKAELHATQAFLMENIKAKNDLMNSIKQEYPKTKAVAPERKSIDGPDFLNDVDEDWGWDQLSVSEYNEYLEAEAFAAHVGQFIHKGGKLDTLRKELPNIKTLDFKEINTGSLTPVIVTVHHDADTLLNTHEELAALHRQYEQRVNYFKAKVKNLVTMENARVQRENSDLHTKYQAERDLVNAEYDRLFKEYVDAVAKEKTNFAESQHIRMAEASALRIQVDSRFQSVIDKFLKDVTE